MKLAKLGNKLCGAVAGDPRKVLSLGIVVGVACYFWSPLSWWETTCDLATVLPKTRETTPSIAVWPVIAQETAAVKPSPNRPNWRQIAEWMRNDPRMAAALPLAEERDPFEVLDGDPAKAKSKQSRKAPRQAISAPTAGLTLTGTILGPKQNIARINGRTYTVGQTIDVMQGKEAEPKRFQLLEIESRRVVLASNGERFELTIPEYGNLGRMEVRGQGLGIRN